MPHLRNLTGAFIVTGAACALQGLNPRDQQIGGPSEGLIALKAIENDPTNNNDVTSADVTKLSFGVRMDPPDEGDEVIVFNPHIRTAQVTLRNGAIPPGQTAADKTIQLAPGDAKIVHWHHGKWWEA